MRTVIKTRLVKIGNSHGVRIPKVVRDQVGLTDAIELEVRGDELIVRASAPRRAPIGPSSFARWLRGMMMRCWMQTRQEPSGTRPNGNGNEAL